MKIKQDKTLFRGNFLRDAAQRAGALRLRLVFWASGVVAFWAGPLLAATGPGEIWVSPEGNDVGPGSHAEPFASVGRALREAREWRRLKDERAVGGVDITVRGGTYYLTEPILVRPEDSGTEAAPTRIRAAAGERPIISGGEVLGEWQEADSLEGAPVASEGRLWVVDAPRVGGWPVRIRDLWVGDRRAQLARDAKGMQFRRLLEWDKEAREGWIEWPEAFGGEEPGTLEMVIHQL
ncbi:MAG: hypothetical protein RL648_340, partial [Verrucomicrobiota bacterium]